MQNVWKFWIICIVLVPVSWVLWFVIMVATSEIFDLPVYPVMSDVLFLMQTGFVWAPIIALILARDFWLYRQVPKRIDGAGCKECEYCLVGLEIKQSKTKEYVGCPECGDQNFLDGIRLAREDIDPAFFPESDS